MQSRRDQVQAYFFVVGRLVAAVVHGRPDVPQNPNKRLNTGGFLGVIVGAVLMGIFGIYGVFVPGGNTSWRQPGTIVMNETTGARYVYLDNELRPVLNYASARLVGGKQSNGQVVAVSESSLSGTPVGQPIGIAGAPDALPTTLGSSPWTVCTGSSGAVTLLLGRSLPEPLTDRQALLVRGPDQALYLVWQGKRHRIPGSAEAEALNYGTVAPVPASAAWLNAVPAGADLAAATPPDVGAPGPRIDGHPSVVGQLYEVRNPALGTSQLYLVHRDGVVPVNPTTATLLMASPAIAAAYRGDPVHLVEVAPAALSGVRATNTGPDLAADLPPQPPTVVTPSPDAMACAEFSPADGMRVTTGILPVTTDGTPTAAHAAGAAADRVVVPAGGGALARSAAGTLYLVTETGTKYPLASDDVASALGYAAQSAVAIPGGLLDLLPAGPQLSPDAALRASG